MDPMHRNSPDATKGSQSDAGGHPGHDGMDALLEVLPVGVFIVDRDSRVRMMNATAAQMLRVEASDVVGRSCQEALCCTFCGELCAARQAQAEGGTHRNFPVDLRRSDGSTVSVRIDAAALGAGDVAVTLRDVTALERVQRAMRERWVFHGLVGVSPAMTEVVGQIRDVAPYDSSVLILGESGTGKEIVARAIHAESPRAAKAFVTVSCSAHSEALLEAELFGQAKGAFLGAERDRAGRFEVAEGGTVFLDDLGEISPKLQVRLLRLLQDHEVERVGESRARPVDVRVIAATHKDLHREVREGRFREDLYYRLNVFTLRLPPLRDRREDVPILAEHLLRRASARTGKEVASIHTDAMEALIAHPWPGNVRELENVLESAVVRCREGVVELADLPAGFAGPSAGDPAVEGERVRTALRRAAGSVTLAAKLLGVHRTTLWRWMCEAGLRREDFQPE